MSEGKVIFDKYTAYNIEIAWSRMSENVVWKSYMPENGKPSTANPAGPAALKPVCGIVMPISEIDGCKPAHWLDVREVLTETIESAGFDAQLVNDAEEVGLIHKRIIQNLYDNPIVVCDISGKNPNVMFELGLRLAFDKPTIIVKDDKTAYSFDTGAIEHLEYPRDLRFNTIVEFKQKLKTKIVATHSKSTSDPMYTTFLKHFGEFKVAKLEKKEVTGQEFILDELRGIHISLNKLQARSRPVPFERRHRDSSSDFPADISLCAGGLPSDEISKIADQLSRNVAVKRYLVERRGDDPSHHHLLLTLKEGTNQDEKAAIDKLGEELIEKARTRSRHAPRPPSA